MIHFGRKVDFSKTGFPGNAAFLNFRAPCFLDNDFRTGYSTGAGWKCLFSMGGIFVAEEWLDGPCGDPSWTAFSSCADDLYGSMKPCVIEHALGDRLAISKSWIPACNINTATQAVSDSTPAASVTASLARLCRTANVTALASSLSGEGERSGLRPHVENVWVTSEIEEE